MAVRKPEQSGRAVLHLLRRHAQRTGRATLTLISALQPHGFIGYRTTGTTEKNFCYCFMASPPVAAALHLATPASSNGRSVRRAARTHVCATRSFPHSMTTTPRATTCSTHATHSCSTFLHSKAFTQISHTHITTRTQFFSQTTRLSTPTSARFLPLTNRFAWPGFWLFFSSLRACTNCLACSLTGHAEPARSPPLPQPPLPPPPSLPQPPPPPPPPPPPLPLPLPPPHASCLPPTCHAHRRV